MVFAGRAQSSMYILLAISETIQSTPSTSPCPLTAEHATMFQCRFTIESSLRICEKTGNQYAIGRKLPADTDTTHFFDFFQRQRPSEVLLVRKDKKGSACTHTPSTMSPDERGIDIWCDVLKCRCRTGEFLLNKKVLKLLSTVAKPSSVCAVYHPHHPVCGLEVVAPIAVRDECACQWRQSTGQYMGWVAGGGREMAPFCAHGSRLPHNPTNKLRTCIQCTCLRSVF